MSSPITFSATALLDARRAYLWYDMQRPGLGRRFQDKLGEVLRVVARHPGTFPTVKGKFRQAPLPVFPYVVVYTERKADVLIMRIFHGKRDPRKKFNRQ